MGSTGPLEQPWIKDFPWSDEASQKIATKVFEYDPKEAGLPIDKLNLLLCGGVGAGKSSIVSLIHSIIKGRTSAVALHGTGSSSVTPDLTKYRFKQPGSTVKPKPVKWQLWDTMGWGVDDYKGGELAFILDGNLPHGCDLRQRLSTKTPKFKVKPSLEEEVHCMCLVVPSNAATDEKYMARLQEMRQAALERRIPTVIFLTKIDAYDPDVVGKDLTKTFHSSKLLELCKTVATNAGVGGQKDVFPIKSMTDESGPTAALQALVCSAVQKALFYAEDYVSNRVNDHSDDDIKSELYN